MCTCIAVDIDTLTIKEQNQYVVFFICTPACHSSLIVSERSEEGIDRVPHGVNPKFFGGVWIYSCNNVGGKLVDCR